MVSKFDDGSFSQGYSLLVLNGSGEGTAVNDWLGLRLIAILCWLSPNFDLTDRDSTLLE